MNITTNQRVDSIWEMCERLDDAVHELVERMARVERHLGLVVPGSVTAVAGELG